MANYDDVLENAGRIHSKIAEIETHRESIFDAATKKAQSLSDYRKKIAVTILQLKNGAIFDFEGNQIHYPLPATLIPTIAQGICYQEAFDRYESEAAYKGLISILDAIKAELNGLQSINRRLE